MQIQLSPEQLSRYNNQLKLPGMSQQNQSKLLRSSVLILGIGGSGAIASQFLTAAGVGNIGLLDNSIIELSHLNNLPLYNTKDVGKPAAGVLKDKIWAVNSDVRTVMHSEQFNAHTAEGILPQYDIVIDGLDNWQDKLLASDICMRMRKPLIHAGCIGFRLQIYSMLPGKSACLRCVFSLMGMEDLAHLKSDIACFGPAAGMAGALQASETIKRIANLGVVPSEQLIQFDMLRHEFSTNLGLTANSDCPDCGRIF